MKDLEFEYKDFYSIDITNKFLKNLEKNISKEYQKLDVDVEVSINAFKNSESIIKYLFEHDGYTTIKLYPLNGNSENKELYDNSGYIREYFNEYNKQHSSNNNDDNHINLQETLYALTTKGVPDFIVFKDIKERIAYGYNGHLMFVEVKTKNDGIRYEQFKWLVEHPKLAKFVVYLWLVD